MIDLLPDELILHVLRFLTPKENTVLSATNSRMRELCNDRSIWRYYLEREHFPFSVENPRTFYFKHNASFRCKFIEVAHENVISVLDHSHVLCKVDDSTVKIENFRSNEIKSFNAIVVSRVVNKCFAYFTGHEVCIYDFKNSQNEIVVKIQEVVQLLLTPSYICISSGGATTTLMHRVRTDLSKSLSKLPSKLIENNHRLLVTYSESVDVFSAIDLTHLKSTYLGCDLFANLVGNYLVTDSGILLVRTYYFYSFLAKSTETLELNYVPIGIYRDKIVFVGGDELILYFPGQPLEKYSLGNLRYRTEEMLSDSLVRLQDPNRISYVFNLESKSILPLSNVVDGCEGVYLAREGIYLTRDSKLYDYHVTIEDYLKSYQERLKKLLEIVKSASYLSSRALADQNKHVQWDGIEARQKFRELVRALPMPIRKILATTLPSEHYDVLKGIENPFD